MDMELLKVRVTAFIYEAGTLIVAGVIGVLASPEFSELISTHFGDTIFGTLVLLVVTGIVKHFRNTVVLGNAQRVGARGGTSAPFHLI